MTISKAWYWTIGSVLLIGASYLLRRQAVDLWNQAFGKRYGIPINAA